MRSACMWEKMASLKKLLQLWLCQRELGSTVRQRESWVSTRAVFSPGNWAGPLLSPSPPSSLPPSFPSLWVSHSCSPICSLPPPCTHVCALPPSPYKSGLLQAIFCSLHFLSLLSVMSSLPSNNQLLQRRFWKKVWDWVWSTGVGACVWTG